MKFLDHDVSIFLLTGTWQMGDEIALLVHVAR